MLLLNAPHHVFSLAAVFLAAAPPAAGYLVNPKLLARLPSFATEGGCRAAFDLLHLQDITSSFEEDVQNLQKQLPAFLEELGNRHDGTRFAFASFADKPIPTAGWFSSEFRRDYCFRVHNGFEDPDSEAFDALEQISVGGGKDWREGQLEALGRAAVAPQLKWRHQGTKERPVLRIVALATDSMPHISGDAARLVRRYNQKHPDALWNNTIIDSELFQDPVNMLSLDEDFNCDTWDYPEAADVGAALRAANILPVFLLAPATFPNCISTERVCAWGPLRQKALESSDERYLNPELGMQLVYESLLDDMEMPGVIVMVDEELRDYSEVMAEALATVAAIVCPDVPLPLDEDHVEQLTTPAAAAAETPLQSKLSNIERKVLMQRLASSQQTDSKESRDGSQGAVTSSQQSPPDSLSSQASSQQTADSKVRAFVGGVQAVSRTFVSGSSESTDSKKDESVEHTTSKAARAEDYTVVYKRGGEEIKSEEALAAYEESLEEGLEKDLEKGLEESRREKPRHGGSCSHGCHGCHHEGHCGCCRKGGLRHPHVKVVVEASGH